MTKTKTKRVKIKSGDDLEKMARASGCKSFKDVFQLPENKALRKKRASPEEVQRGDVVQFPDGPVKPKKTTYTADNGRMKMTIDGEAKRIKVVQTWSFEFIKESSHRDLPDWTSKEKSEFKKAIDKQIHKRWNKRCKMGVSGGSDFAAFYGEQEFLVEIDLQIVASGGHWVCKAHKIPDGTTFKSNVDWGRQIVYLDIHDQNPKESGPKRDWISDEDRKKLRARDQKREARGKKAKGEKTRTYKQDTGAHEFGHTMGSVAIPTKDMHGDEYYEQERMHDGKMMLYDRKSMMNVGNELRDRHFDHLVKELSKVIPKTQFRVTKTR